DVPGAVRGHLCVDQGAVVRGCDDQDATALREPGADEAPGLAGKPLVVGEEPHAVVVHRLRHCYVRPSAPPDSPHGPSPPHSMGCDKVLEGFWPSWQHPAAAPTPCRIRLIRPR